MVHAKGIRHFFLSWLVFLLLVFCLLSGVLTLSKCPPIFCLTVPSICFASSQLDASGLADTARSAAIRVVTAVVSDPTLLHSCVLPVLLGSDGRGLIVTPPTPLALTTAHVRFIAGRRRAIWQPLLVQTF